MASPITWRNVSGPDLTGAAAILGRSQDNFQNMFDGLQGVMDTARNTQIANQENQVNLNTVRFEEMLRSRYRSPEELQAAQQSGELDALRQQFGEYGLDTDRTGAAAIDTLVSGLQTRARENQEYSDYRTRLNNREARDAHDVAIAEGRFADAARIRAENDFLNEGAMARDQTTAEQDLENLNWTRENRANTRADRAEAERQRALRKQGESLAAEMFLHMNEPGANSTQLRNELFNSLMQVPGMDMGLATELTGETENADYLTSQLSKRTQGELQQAMDAIDASTKKNSFAKWEASEESATAAANRILESNRERIEDGWNIDEAYDFAYQAMTEGLDLGNGKPYPMPPEFVEYVIQHTDPKRFLSAAGDGYTSLAQEILGQSKYWSKQLDEFADAEYQKTFEKRRVLRRALGYDLADPVKPEQINSREVPTDQKKETGGERAKARELLQETLNPYINNWPR